MGVGYFEAMMTPFSVMMDDLKMMELENEYGYKKEELPKKQKGLKHAHPQQ